MTELRVELSSPVPVYEQIRSQVSALVAVGGLRPGDRLPASRDLARDLGIAVGTVQRAYRELEAAGAVTSRRRVGTVIAETAAGPGGKLPAGNRPGGTPSDGTDPDGAPTVDGGLPEGPAGARTSGTGGLVADARALVAKAREQGLGDEAVLALVRGALLPERR